MRKIFLFATVCLFAVLFSSCESSNTPEGVVKKSMRCLMDKDYKGYMELVYFDNKDGKIDEAKIDEKRAGLTELMEDKVDKQYQKKGGIESYEIVETVIQEDGQKAKVVVKLKFANGTEENTNVTLVKNSEDKWMIDLGK